MTMSRWLKQVVITLFWALVAAGTIVVGVVVCIPNYLGCRSALELLGFEPQPVATDPVVGTLLDSVFASATQAHFIAMFIVVAEASAFFFLTHLLADVLRLFHIRRRALTRGDREEARLAVQAMVHDALYLSFFAALLVPVVRWDIDLFRYRSLAGAYGIEDPAVATATIQSWAIELRERGNLFAWHVALNGAWGYVAATALACIGFEFACGRLSEHYSAAAEPAEQLLASKFRRREEEYGEEYEEEAVEEPATGNGPTPAAPVAATVDESIPQAIAARMGGVRVNGSANGHTNGHVNGSANGTALFEAPVMPSSRVPSEAPQPQEAATLPVIGSDDERVTLAVALERPDRYHVDPMTRQVFSRVHWEELHAEAVHPEPEEARS